MLNRFCAILVLGLTLLLATGCTLSHDQKPNILIISVDGLGVNDINCSREAKPMNKSGFDLLCKNSVRFTHAYTPSPLTLPALSSLMSGLYPFETGVHNNGPNFLPVRFPNISKTAFQNGYRTAFFSGGPPALRSSGLQLGVENFDDNINPNIKNVFRPAEMTFIALNSWLKDIDSAFLAVVFLPDLIFTNHETIDEFGEKRNLTRESQLENLDNNLGQLFFQMKKSKTWDQTNIILLGLNADPTDPDSRKNFLEMNLHSDRTQISLLIKPAGKPRDEGLAWSYDEPVTIPDVGRTIFSLLEAEPNIHSKLSVYSLIEEIKKPTITKKPERWIYAESYWGPWRQQSGPVFSLRKNNLLFIQDSGRHFYNTFTDRQENIAIPVNDSIISPLVTELNNVKKIAEIPDLPLNPIFQGEILSDKNQAFALLQQGRWKELLALGSKIGQNDWMAIAERNLGMSQTNFLDPCLQLLEMTSATPENRRQCSDRNTLILSDLVLADAQGDLHNREIFRKKLAPVQKIENLFSALRMVNLEHHEIWNISEQRSNDLLNFEIALRHPRVSRLHLN